MSAGTLTLTNNSAAVSGSGTAFTTELAAGDFIVVTVGGIPYTLPVKTVNSNTSLTLVSNFTGPTQSGAAWSAIPRIAMNLVTAAVVAQAAEALRGLNYDKQNWQQVFSAPGMITVRLPDGSSFPGPSWKYLSDNMATKEGGAVPINQGGTGSNTESGARANLGLEKVSSAEDVMPGRMINVGYFGIGSQRGVDSPTFNDANNAIYNGFYTARGAAGVNYANPFEPMLVIARGMNSVGQVQINPNSMVRVRGGSAGTFSAWATLYGTNNTTKSSDGTLKAASPVARIVNSQDENQRRDVAEDGFMWCGCGTANKEAEGITISRLDVGVYVLTGAVGLASEGWQLLPPMDPGGMGELGVVEAEQTESGGLVIRLFKHKYMLSDSGEIVKTKGDPIDVPANSWIDVRMDMPEDSAWNRKQAEANNGSDIPDGAGI